MTQNKFIYDFGIDHYKGIQGIFFYKVLHKIIQIGKLNERSALKVLDFGCGLKKLKPYVTNYIGYDIDKRFTEIKDWRDADFDVVVANAVFMYMSRKELETFIKQLYKHNPNAELIFATTKMNLITKTFKFITSQLKGYADTKLSYKEQMKLLTQYFDIIKKKTILGLNDIYLLRYK